MLTSHAHKGLDTGDTYFAVHEVKRIFGYIPDLASQTAGPSDEDKTMARKTPGRDTVQYMRHIDGMQYEWVKERIPGN